MNNASTHTSRYGYNGKELIDDMDIGIYDYGARFYDPSIGRFTGVDPLADQFLGWSPYNYTMNNPINMIDPDGRAPTWIPDESGNLIAEQGDNASTLAKHFGFSLSEATNILSSQNVAYENLVASDPTVKEGQKIKLDNQFTRSIANNNNNNNNNDNNASICHGCAYSGSQVNERSGSMIHQAKYGVPRTIIHLA